MISGYLFRWWQDTVLHSTVVRRPGVRRALLSVLLFAIVPWQALANAWAGSPTPSDFAFGLVLEVDGDGSVYGMSLPTDVYRNVTRPDLGDMRVYNSHDKIVPHAVRTLPAELAPRRAPVALPMFPLYCAAPGTVPEPVHITTNSQDAIVDVSGPARGDTGHRLCGYLLDASGLPHSVGRLTLRWRGPIKSAGFVSTVTVEGSDDLVHWHVILRNETVAELYYHGYRLGRHRLDLPANRCRYLRLLWPKDRKPAPIATVEAAFPRTKLEQARQWSRVDGHAVLGRPGTYDFDSRGFFPIDRIEVVFPNENELVNASIYSRTDASAPWQLRYHGRLYDVRIDGVRLDSTPIVLAARNDRLWQLRLNSTGKSMAIPPVLALGWIPQQLLFVAHGQAPFELAYGSSRVSPTDTPAATLLRPVGTNGAGLVKSVQVGARVELGGPGRLRSSRKAAVWKGWLPWLVLGFIVLGAAVWRKYTSTRDG